MTVHPRVSLHQVAFAREGTTAFLDHCDANGIPNVTLVTSLMTGPDDARRARAARCRVTTINHPFAVYPNLENDSGGASRRLVDAVSIATDLGAAQVYVLTGGRGALTWEQAADRFAEMIAPAKIAAERVGVSLVVENASPFNVDIHIAHTLADTIRLAEIADIGICIDLHACWAEGDLPRLFAQAAPNTRLVQVSDYVLGDRTAPCRAVPGDGAIPLEQLLAELLAVGYEGGFDVELVGPRIDAEGPEPATVRAVHTVSDMLTRLGA